MRGVNRMTIEMMIMLTIGYASGITLSLVCDMIARRGM